ncbi:hypothetical protein [Polymorphospora sp. NPDC050346]|uniref:hypothetical protein n=1 Tax=Polymorphospora sp. NPDC050346 TaxID=3155780 RepID=UPI0033E4D973
MVVLLGVCGLTSYFLVADERKGRDARAAGGPAVAQPRDITSQAVDPAPLTVEEVFPTADLVINPKEPPYQVLKTEVAPDCAGAAGGGIAELLGGAGCTQVVRATLRSPSGEYLLTAGIFNLVDEAAAGRVHEGIKPLVAEESGRFQGMVAGAGTEPVVHSSGQVGWHFRGHFLAYAVIAKATGDEIDPGDQHARQILYDVIELHLRGTVLERRATVADGEAGPAAAAQPGS